MKAKIYTLAASLDEKMLIELTSALKDEFPDHFNRMSVRSWSATPTRSSGFQLTTCSEREPTPAMKDAIRWFRAGWKAQKALQEARA